MDYKKSKARLHPRPLHYGPAFQRRPGGYCVSEADYEMKKGRAENGSPFLNYRQRRINIQGVCRFRHKIHIEGR